MQGSSGLTGLKGHFAAAVLALLATAGLFAAPALADEGDSYRTDILVFDPNDDIPVEGYTYYGTSTFINYVDGYGNYTLVPVDGTGNWTRYSETFAFYTNYSEGALGFSDTDTDASVLLNRVFFDLSSDFDVSGTLIKETAGGATVAFYYDSTTPNKTKRNKKTAKMVQKAGVYLAVAVRDSVGDGVDEEDDVALGCSLKAKVKADQGEANTTTSLKGSNVTVECTRADIEALGLNSEAMAIVDNCLDGKDKFKIKNKTNNFRRFDADELDTGFDL